MQLFFRNQNGDPFLVWKTDGNSQHKPCWINAVATDSTGTKLVGNTTKLLTNNLSWEGEVVEGPWVFYEPTTARWVLIYSANAYDRATYALGVASSTNPLGPYTKHPHPVLHTADKPGPHSWPGPGHCSLIKVGAPMHDPAAMNATSPNVNYNWAVIYHAWVPGAIGSARNTLVDSVTWEVVSGVSVPIIFGGPSGNERATPSETPKPIPRPASP